MSKQSFQQLNKDRIDKRARQIAEDKKNGTALEQMLMRARNVIPREWSPFVTGYTRRVKEEYGGW